MFTCNAAGSPASTITWKKDSNLLTTVSDARYNVAGGKLTISRLTIQDAGNFSCIASQSGYKTEESARAVLTLICMYVS